MFTEIILAAIVTGTCAILASASKGLCTHIFTSSPNKKQSPMKNLQYHNLFDQLTYWKRSQLVEIIQSAEISSTRKHIHAILNILLDNIDHLCKELILYKDEACIQKFQTKCINVVVDIVTHTCTHCKNEDVPDELLTNVRKKYKRLIILNKSMIESVCTNRTYLSNHIRLIAIFNVIESSIRSLFATLPYDIVDLNSAMRPHAKLVLSQ